MRLVTFCYRKIIDAASTRPWDKLVFEDSYRELLMQAQYFNPERRYRTFGELLHHAPGADRLHFLVSGAVRGYLQQLTDVVPDVTDNLGRLFLKFTRFQFEVINSDFQDKSRHQVAINFFADPLEWHDTVGDFLLVAVPQQPGPEVLTHLFRLGPYVSIHSLQPLP